VFGSTILDVVIGLAFVFFVFSLLVSGINEGVRKILNTRSKVLWASIRRLLDETDDSARRSYDPRLPEEPRREVTSGLAPAGSAGDVGVAPSNASLFDQFYNHPLISRLDPAIEGKRSRITHIPPREFARAFVDILAPRDENGAPIWDAIGNRVAGLPAPLRSQFEVLVQEAGDDVKALRRAFEGWFDSSMERVSDWYKKRSRKIMIVYGLIVAGAFNVSAVVITADLYEDEIVREAVVSLAENQVGTGDSTAACTDRECIEETVGSLVETRIPVLWRRCEIGGGETRLCGFESYDRWAATIVGWFVTAAALSMGASFWFTILKKAFKVRDTRQT